MEITNKFILELISLSNPAQSSTYRQKSCKDYKCIASKAIDGDLTNKCFTKLSRNPWWSAQLDQIVKIEHIFVYAVKYQFEEQKAYTNFKVETALTKGMWESCKKPYNVSLPINPHITICDNTKIAKYIRFSRVLNGRGRLILSEVKITGSVQGKIFYSSKSQSLGNHSSTLGIDYWNIKSRKWLSVLT